MWGFSSNKLLDQREQQRKRRLHEQRVHNAGEDRHANKDALTGQASTAISQLWRVGCSGCTSSSTECSVRTVQCQLGLSGFPLTVQGSSDFLMTSLCTESLLICSLLYRSRAQLGAVLGSSKSSGVLTHMQDSFAESGVLRVW